MKRIALYTAIITPMLFFGLPAVAHAQGSQTTTACQYVTGADQGKCNQCMASGKGAWTAIGCIQTDPGQFVGEVLRVGISIGGGVAFLLILFGGFQILTSAGNPEQLTAGRELVTSAITGLLLIIFSIFILRLIGVSIFNLPGFS